MKRSLSIYLLAAGLAFFLSFSFAAAEAAERVYRMQGKITAIDLKHDTVVVEVPVQGGKLLTVGGPVAPDAVVEKAGKSARLKDFNLGDRVTVKWKVTERTHLILSLKAA